MAQGPNPIEIYQGAAQAMIPTVGSVTAAQLGSNTPCIEWTVKNLINHNINTQNFLQATLTGAQIDPATMFNVDGDLPQEGGEAALKSIIDQVVSTANAMDLSTIVATPFGEMPAGNFIMFPMLDLVIHRWDLASALGQDNTIDSSMAEICVGILGPEALAGGRQQGAFGSEVIIPASGSIQDKLLGSVGRTP